MADSLVSLKVREKNLRRFIVFDSVIKLKTNDRTQVKLELWPQRAAFEEGMCIQLYIKDKDLAYFFFFSQGLHSISHTVAEVRWRPRSMSLRKFLFNDSK